MSGLTTIAALPRAGGAGMELKGETNIPPKKYATGGLVVDVLIRKLVREHVARPVAEMVAKMINSERRIEAALAMAREQPGSEFANRTH